MNFIASTSGNARTSEQGTPSPPVNKLETQF